MDPLFGIFVGTYGYYLYEKEHRPRGRSLRELALRKWNKQAVSQQSMKN